MTPSRARAEALLYDLGCGVGSPDDLTIAERHLDAHAAEAVADSDSCLAMVAETLTALGCQHKGETGEHTPPMMYPEWIRCVVANAVADAVRAERERCARIAREHEGDFYDGQYEAAKKIAAKIAALRAPEGKG